MHFYSIFDNPLTLRSIYNAVEVGLITAVVGGALAFAIGYTIHRTQVTGRRWIDLISTLPVAIPGLVVGVAYLWAWIGIPGGLYGTIWILALAFIARFMPDTVKSLSTSFLRIIANSRRPPGSAARAYSGPSGRSCCLWRGRA